MKEEINWDDLKALLEGELSTSGLSRIAYATDASVYRTLPLGVVYPKHGHDIEHIVRFALKNNFSLIPRTAGTSLAGQVVGKGLVVDVSRYMSQIIEVNKEEKWVDVQPGVIRDVLNEHLVQYGLFFGPNTSTSNRCMIGGMVGNNSSGSTSIKYGCTRDKVMELDTILSDGSKATFAELSQEAVQAKLANNSLEGAIYKETLSLLMPAEVQAEIKSQYPKSKIERRNTGYAIDVLISQQPFNENGANLNLAKLLAGSEGTLSFTTRIRLKLDDLPPAKEAVICAHFHSIADSMKATVAIMSHAPYACELMDRTILELTKGNAEQNANRFFVEGDPGAILAIEVRGHTDEEFSNALQAVVSTIENETDAFAFPVVRGPKTSMVWALRAAGLGVLSNVPGDAKPVAFVEDTAVEINDLPNYISEFEGLMSSFNQQAVYYAHAGAGELHLRPILNLKEEKGRADFRKIGEASAKLVKKYKGSLSGEHGDGRVRAEFIPIAIGAKNYALLQQIKKAWDPHGIFNPGKIVDADPMDGDLRYENGQGPFSWPTFLNFGEEDMQQAVERCNGSGDCRKPAELGATMCPSYQATKNELDSTRARANVLREVMTRPDNPAYPLDSEEVKEVLDLCLSCKACKRDCPSSVDMAALKAEAMYQYQRRHGVSKSSAFFGNFHRHAARVWPFRKIANAALKNKFIGDVFRSQLDVAPERSIPKFSDARGSTLAQKYNSKKEGIDFVLYIDEFTEFQDAHIAEAAAIFFQKIGLNFKVIYSPSGRAAISKALLKEARKSCEATIQKLFPYAEKDTPIVGLEPSGILGFRDDILKLVTPETRSAADAVASNTFTFEEYVDQLISQGKLSAADFTEESREVAIHLHCHQKSLSHIKHSKSILNLPLNFHAITIPSGCCGMAGSFGFESKHFALSQSIGELVLFPYVRKNPSKTIVASGTSCRHQLEDGVAVKAQHPAQVLLSALK